MLRDVTLKAVYNSEQDNILTDFYIPILSHAVSYDRAVGYFDAKMLTSAASGLAVFIENGGYMRLVCGATLSEEEYQAIKKGYDVRPIKERLEHDFRRIVQSDDSDLFKHQLNVLTWMVRERALDVKIALRRHGIHHQKIGIFRDTHDDFIVFQGSANETLSALLPFNYETINVFKGWRHEFKDHYEPHITSFDDLWHNRAKDTHVIDFSSIAQNVLSQSSIHRPSIQDEIALWQAWYDTGESPPPPQDQEKRRGGIQLRPHQRDALESWKRNNDHGIFEHATGSGKTITAIYGAVELYEEKKRLFVVVSVPYQNLAEQWAENMRLFKLHPIMCYGGEKTWRDRLDRNISALHRGHIDLCVAIVVNATLTSPKGTFLGQLQRLKENIPFLFIGDECHHHGADRTAQSLPAKARFRMGLSATPGTRREEQDEEDESAHRINRYYGKVVSTYSLKDALDDGVLTPYDYYPMLTELNHAETEDYITLSKEIARLYAILENSGDTGNSQQARMRLNTLLRKRTQVVNGAESKRTKLADILRDIKKPIKYTLFYCAEGTLEGESADDGQDDVKHISAIQKIAHRHGWRTSQFTAAQNKKEREGILDDFKDGDIHALVAMKCLDEGVDIPACKTAFILASTRNSRQFIQRRGRILRKSPHKEKAIIYDFCVMLKERDGYASRDGKKLAEAELRRIAEFAKLSENYSETYFTLKPYLEKYRLHHLM
ncbi:MAG: DEAD/DEAH box helicase family protein [Alphaproteobacteria bacterium GM7ARS4]|nr:DEAD/DEAH box helicase family protein [Alphaproteobacteria bacterium GM7ARS4]